MRFTPPSVGTVARGNAPGGGKEAGRRALHGGNRPRPQRGAGLWPSGRGLLGGSSSALSQLRPRPGAAGVTRPILPATEHSGLGLGPAAHPAPARPAPPTRPDPEAEGAVPAVAGAWPRPVAGRGSAGRGAGWWGLRRPEPAPFPSWRSSPLSHGARTPSGLLTLGRPLLGAPSPRRSRSPFSSGPTHRGSPLQLHVPLPLLFRVVLQEVSTR